MIRNLGILARIRSATSLRGLAIALVVCGPVLAQVPGSQWLQLKEDSIHDPRAPSVRILQEPAQALGEIARRVPDSAGNRVRWVKAIEERVIQPRASLKDPAFAIKVDERDVYMDIGGSMPVVRFPHRPHTLWLDCKNCHDDVFVAKAGANKITMFEILQGNQCGICHGAVAFPLTECGRCHSINQKDFEAMYRENRMPANAVLSFPPGKTPPGYVKK